MEKEQVATRMVTIGKDIESISREILELRKQNTAQTKDNDFTITLKELRINALSAEYQALQKL